MPTATLQVPVEQVTLDARFVAETIARVWELAERLIDFTGEDSLQSKALDKIGEDIYRASFAFEHDERGETAGLWKEIADLATARAEGRGDDA